MSAKKGKKKRKTVSKPSCASGRAYKKSGRCVPKKKGKKVAARRTSRSCWAKTRDIAITKMDLVDKRAKEREVARAQANAAEAAAAVRAEEGAAFTAGEYNGLGGVRSRRRRRWR